MRYEVIINRKFFETNSTKVYNDLTESKAILKWMIDNSCDYQLAAIEFDYLERTLRLKLARAGHRAVVDWGKRRKIVQRACEEWIKTTSIKNICEETGVSKVKMKYRMQNSGFSLPNKKFTLVRNSNNKALTTKLDIPNTAAMYNRILYTKFLSYRADFKMFQPYRLQG